MVFDKKEYQKKYYEAHKEELKKYQKKYQRTWYEQNKVERSAQIKEYGKQHREDSVRRTQKYVAKNKDKVYEYGRQYNQTTSGGYRMYKSNALKRGKDFTLTNEEFTVLVSSECVYCGEKTLRRGIDRIDNTKGYTKENSAPCCKICNYMKKTMTAVDFIAHVRKIAAHNI